MKAAIYEKYGPPEVLQIEEVEKPAAKDNEVLIRIHATTVTAMDYRCRAFKVPAVFWLPARISLGITGPKTKILGGEFAGIIEAVGKDVTQFKEGDQVFGFSNGLGAYAEYLCMPADGPMAIKPENLTLEEAVGVPFGAITSLFFFKKGNIQSGQKVLINGASGAVGVYAVQLAKHFGADVTGVCSAANVEMVKSLDADAVIDYTKEDFTRNGETYDIIFETVGAVSYSRCKNSLKEGGVYLAAVLTLGTLLQMLRTSMFGNKKIICTVAKETAKDLEFFKELLEAKHLRPVIDRRYPLDQIVEAHRYADTGRKKGSVVITVAH